MRILITGGAGFVGSNLAITLSEQGGYKVVAMDNLYRRGSEFNIPRLKAAGVEFFHGDVRNPESFPAPPFDVLIECSAEPSVLAGLTGSPDHVYHTNLTGAYNCLEKARAWKSRFIFMSTSRIYPVETLEAHHYREEETRFMWSDHGSEDGISSQGVTEKTRIGVAGSLYGYTKLAAELLIAEYVQSFGLQATVNRCGVIAGPWQFGKSDQGLASLWVLAHQFGRPLTYIGYGGRGKQVRDFIHVQDICDLIHIQVEEPEAWNGWVGNVSGGLENSLSLLELTALCEKATGKKVPIAPVIPNRPADLRLYIGDCAKLLAATNWRPKHNAEAIIGDTAKWVRDHQTLLATL
jgi:CDP-paratose 2-epimerase